MESPVGLSGDLKGGCTVSYCVCRDDNQVLAWEHQDPRAGEARIACEVSPARTWAGSRKLRSPQLISFTPNSRFLAARRRRPYRPARAGKRTHRILQFHTLQSLKKLYRFL